MANIEIDASFGTVFVVDDDLIFLRAMKRLLGRRGYLVETFDSAKDFLQREVHCDYGCLLVDLRMPDESGLNLQEQLNQQDYTMPIIFMTGAGDTESGVTAMKNGAVDFLLKPVENDVLFDAIADAIEKDRDARMLFDRRVSARKAVESLTGREKEILEHVVTGTRNKEIAYQLQISEKTVKAHRGKVMHKSGAKTIIDLAAIAELAYGVPVVR